MAIKIWTKDFAAILPDIFQKKSAFLRAFGGNIQTITGAEATENYLELKTSDTDVVIQSYNTGADVAFGAGTGSTNRFGERKEVKSVDAQVKFDDPLAIHEGIDKFTVNDLPEQVLAERLALHGVAWAERYDAVMSETISDNADLILLEPITEVGIVSMFNTAHKTFVNNGVSTSIPWVAYVNTDVYNILVDSQLASLLKAADVNVSQQTLYHFKGFIIQEVPDAKFQVPDVIYFVADNVGVAGVGIEVARTLDSEDFAGVALQAAGKLGKYIPEKNKKAIIKASKIVQGLQFGVFGALGLPLSGVKITIGDEVKYTDVNGMTAFATKTGTITWTISKNGWEFTPDGDTATVLEDVVSIVPVVATAITTTIESSSEDTSEDDTPENT